MSELLVHGRTHRIDRMLVMGVVNASPESFSDASVDTSTQSRTDLAARLVDEGADVIDVGGQSAITNQPELDAELERDRVLPIVEWLVKERPDVLVSVDTYKPLVVQAVLDAGAHLVNDVSGLQHPEVAAMCARAGAALVVMHTRARPKQRLQDKDLYDDVTADVVSFLAERLELAEAQGLDRRSLVVDPGPDFTKTPAQTIAMLRRLDEVRALGRPVLLALSRKDFLGAITGRSPRGRDAATHAALAFFAAQPGIVRVHEVAAARDVIATVEVLAGQRDVAEDYLLPDAIRHEPRP
ncbi:MAG TPA: dihydropteroate synthase [Nocardioides sp.]